MTEEAYRYAFVPETPWEEVEATLLLALFAVEGLYGETQVCLDAALSCDPQRRACVIDAGTTVGRGLNKVFTALIRRELGTAAFQVERVAPARPRAASA
jgi:hypothetical protein